MRSILHIRIDSFFASAERKRRPELVGKPIVVGGPKGNTSRVVVSVSREAARLGVEEGMSVYQAQRACPDAIVVAADYPYYRQISEQFMDILAQYSPLLEPDSLGSAYMDVTGSRTLFGDAHQVAAQISSRVMEKLGLTVTVGCASSKLVAKVASGGGKPFTRVAPGSEAAFLAPLPVGMLDFVNARIEKRLGELGVASIGQLAMIPERFLIRQFGPVGSAISRQSRGVDPSQVKAAYPPDVIRIEQTFDNALEEPAQVEECLRRMANEAVIRLRKRNSLVGELTLVLFGEQCGASEAVRNPQFQIPNSLRFKKPTDSAASIVQALVKLLGSVMKPGMEVSQVRVVLSELTQGSASQLCLIGDGERRRRLDRVVELVRARFGDGSLIFASSMSYVC